jgi:hypothetical protein
MKTIKLTESQMQLISKLIKEEDAPDFENGDTQEFGNTEQIGITSSLHDVDGNTKNGSAMKQLRQPDTMSRQWPFYTGWGRSSQY